MHICLVRTAHKNDDEEVVSSEADKIERSIVVPHAIEKTTCMQCAMRIAYCAYLDLHRLPIITLIIKIVR